MSTKFDAGLAVEIIEPNPGSACLIGGRLVLTSAHVVGAVGSSCEIRSKNTFGVVKAQVVWVAANADLALVELPNGIESNPSRFGKFPEWHQSHREIDLPVSFFGYPEWATTIKNNEDGTTTPFSGGRQIGGFIYLGDESADDLLVIEPKRRSERLSDSDKSPWGGASGSAIVCQALIVAVLKWHQKPDQQNSLEAQPLHVVYDNPKWRSLLRQHGISPDFQEITLPQSKPKSTTIESRNSSLNISEITNYIDLLNWIEEKTRFSSTGIRSLSALQRKNLRRVIRIISENSLETEVAEMDVLELVVHYVCHCLEMIESPFFKKMKKTEYINKIKQHHRNGTVIRSGNSSLSYLVERSEKVFGKPEMANLVRKMEKINEL